MRLKPALFAVATILFLPTLASAQVPFFTPGVSAFTFREPDRKRGDDS